MSVLRILYLLLAVAGGVSALLGLYGALLGEVISVAEYISVGRVYEYYFYVGWDGLITAISLMIWVLSETYVRKNHEALLAIPATLLLGVGCGLPLYLFLRSRPIT